jgi:hypothetical protein
LRSLRGGAAPLPGPAAPRLRTPTHISRATRSAPTETRVRRWRIWTVAGHPFGACPSGHTHRGHEPRFAPTVMAIYEDRQRDQNQRGNQAAPPPSILSQYLLLETAQTRFEALLGCLISTASGFFRHGPLPLFAYFGGAMNKGPHPAHLKQNRCHALIISHPMPRLMQRRSAVAKVSSREAGTAAEVALSLSVGQGGV